MTIFNIFWIWVGMVRTLYFTRVLSAAGWLWRLKSPFWIHRSVVLLLGWTLQQTCPRVSPFSSSGSTGVLHVPSYLGLVDMPSVCGSVAKEGMNEFLDNHYRFFYMQMEIHMNTFYYCNIHHNNSRKVIIEIDRVRKTSTSVSAQMGCLETAKPFAGSIFALAPMSWGNHEEHHPVLQPLDRVGWWWMISLSLQKWRVLTSNIFVF